MALVWHNRSSLESIPTAQIITQIYGLEAWRIDVWVATPGSVIYGLPAEAVAGFVGNRLETLRAELIRREFAVEAGR